MYSSQTESVTGIHVYDHYILPSALSRPREVIGSRFLPSDALNDVLQAFPEPNYFQGIVQPPSRDAEVGLMRGNVVDTMVPPWQNYMQPLKQYHPPR